MPEATSLLMCLTTAANKADASQIATALLDQSAAACVQIEGPIESHYRWNGEICCDTEFRLVIKSALTSEALIKAVMQLHPYEQPQIVIFKSEAVEEGYQSWVDQNCNPER